MDTSTTPATRRVPSGASPPAKRMTRSAQPPDNAVEQEMRDAMEDHATKLDKQQQYIVTLTAIQVERFTTIERKDIELRDKLQQLEAQVVKNDTRLDTAEAQIAKNDTRLATAETVVSANDVELKKNLLILEQQLSATEGVAAAAMAATTADGSSAATAASHAALVTRLEQHEAYIAKVEQMTRGFANDHQNNGQQMYDAMNTHDCDDDVDCAVGACCGSPVAATVYFISFTLVGETNPQG